MNLPDWFWLPNPDDRHLLQFLWREALPRRMPFRELISELDVPACIPNEPLVVIEGHEKDDDVLGAVPEAEEITGTS
jgi:hypothetical protein